MEETLPPVHRPADDFSFVEVAVILWRYRWLLLFILAGCWGYALRSLLQLPEQYESRGVVKIGRNRLSQDINPRKDQQDRLIEPADVLALRLREEFRPGNTLGAQFGEARVQQATFDRDADELLTVIARGKTAIQTRDFLQAVLSQLISRHETMFIPERLVCEERLEIITRELTDLLNSTNISDSVARLQVRVQLEQEAVQLRLQIIYLNVQPTQIISPPSLPSVKVPRPYTVQLGVATILGLVLGSAAALGWEFLRQVRRSARQRPA